MKIKNLFVFAGLGFVTAVVAVTVFTARYKNAVGDLFMQNVEALTENESSGCPGGQNAPRLMLAPEVVRLVVPQKKVPLVTSSVVIAFDG